MPDVPPNPFQRPQPEPDPRTSRLFAHHDSQASRLAPPSPQQPTQPQNQQPTRPPQQNPQRAGAPQASARRTARLKHNQVRRNILIAVSVVIGLLLALIATDTLKLGTGPRPSLSDSPVSARTTQTSTVVAGEQIESLRTLSGKNPLRVYIGGDSLVGSFGQTLGTTLGESGVINATYDSRPSSGLVNTDFFNWFTHAKSMVSTYDPEMIIFMVGTNDASIVSSNPSGYVATYEKKLNDFFDVVSPGKRKVFMVLAPAMKESALDKNVNKLNEVIRRVSLEREAHVIDSSDVLSPAGTFTLSVTSGSKKVAVRADDGVHITAVGGKLLSAFLYKTLDNLYGLSSYDESPIIKPTKVPGCCTLPTSIPSGTTSQGTKSSTSTSSPSSSTSSSTPGTSSSEPQDPIPPIPVPEDPDTE